MINLYLIPILSYTGDRHILDYTLLIICYIIIPIIMLYRRGYLLNLKGRITEIKDWIKPAPAPSEWTATSVRRLSRFEKAQIESLTIKREISFSPANFYRYYIDVKIKHGEHTSYPLAKEIAASDELRVKFLLDEESFILDKNKVLIRKIEKIRKSSYWDIMPL